MRCLRDSDISKTGCNCQEGGILSARLHYAPSLEMRLATNIEFDKKDGGATRSAIDCFSDFHDVRILQNHILWADELEATSRLEGRDDHMREGSLIAIVL